MSCEGSPIDLLQPVIGKKIEQNGKKALYGTDYCTKRMNSDLGCNGCEGKEGCRELVKAALQYYETGGGLDYGTQ